MNEQLSAFLALEGFVKARTNLETFSIFLKKETAFVNVIFTYTVPETEILTKERFVTLKESAFSVLSQKDLPEIHALFLLLSKDVDRAVEASSGDSMTWIMDTGNNMLVIPEDRTEDFYGMKGRLNGFLADPGRAEAVLAQIKQDFEKTVDATEKELKKSKKEFVPWVSITIIGINLLIILLCLIFGEGFAGLLTLDPVAVFEKYQWYRLFTHLFVHFGLVHFFNNMLMLYMEGITLEETIGRWRFAVIYVLFGMAAGAGSLFYKIYTQTTIPSVGASGAIMGLMGLLIVMTIVSIRSVKNGGWYRFFGIMVCAGYNIYRGFLSESVDNAAHITGFVIGILVGAGWVILSRMNQKNRTGEN